jgi:hypothetical protein
VRRIEFVLLLSLYGTVIGCGSSEDPVKYFQENQKGTTTPHGRVLIETVKATGNGEIQYETEDGKLWSVRATPNGQGGYSYGSPIEHK